MKLVEELRRDDVEVHTDDDGNHFVVLADYERVLHVASRALRDIAGSDRGDAGGPRVRLLKARAREALRELGKETR